MRAPHAAQKGCNRRRAKGKYYGQGNVRPFLLVAIWRFYMKEGWKNFKGPASMWYDTIQKVWVIPTN